MHQESLPDTAVDVIEAMRTQREAVRIAQAREFELTARFANLYSTVDDDSTLPGHEKLVQVGSDGTPAVAEHCALELAAALHLRKADATLLIAHALDVRHRLPNLWRRTLAGKVPVWQARKIATHTTELDAHHAGLVDLVLSRQMPGMAWRRIENLVEGLVLEHLEPEAAEARRCEALDRRGLWVEQSHAGVATVHAVVNAADAILLDAQVDRLARILLHGGDTTSEDARRSRALGLLAAPALALDPIQADAQDQLPAGEALEQLCDRHGHAGHTCGQVSVEPDKLLPTAQLVVHLTDTTLAERDGTGLVRAEGLMPLLLDWLTDALGAHHRITVRPVIDQNHHVASDAYECPATMREAVELRNPVEVFPWSTRRSKGLDLDHTIPRAPRQARGPGRAGGPTHPDNLGPLTRSVHRAKTHAGWHLHQPLPGIYLWQSPLGYRYLVTPSRTLDLGRPDTPRILHEQPLATAA